MNFPQRIKDKLKTLPPKPGVYFMRDRRGKVIYVGKALSLRNRVRSYFRNSTFQKGDPKLRGLIKSIYDFDFLVLKTEAEAAITEGQLIKDYKPHYNILLKDDKRFLLLKIDIQHPFPKISTCRLKKDDGARYFGQYASSTAAKVAKEFLERRFGLRTCRPQEPDNENYKHCHDDVIRYCSAPCVGRISKEEYRSRIDEACAFLNGERPAYLAQLREAMTEAATEQDFERAAALRDTLFMLQKAIKERAKVKKSPKLMIEEARRGVDDLHRNLGLRNRPAVIETFDISNISGTYAVASLVASVEGRPQPQRYRRYKIKTVIGPDDPRMMAEVIHRRYKRLRDEGSPMPDLVLVDGGITQLRAARRELDDLGLFDLELAGLAKRFEEVYRPHLEEPVRMPLESPALLVLRQIRDEAHRFAITYHRELRNKRIRDSVLDDIPGIGETRKKALLKHFGSVTRLRKATIDDICAVPGFGSSAAQKLYDALR